MPIKGLAHTCFRVQNLQKSVAFYCDGLGFTKAFEFKDENGEVFGVYLKIAGRAFIELFKTDSVEKANGQSFQHICLEVGEIESAVAELRKRGIECSEPLLGNDQSWQAWITDPDGNRIELHAYTDESWQAPHLG